MTVDAWLAIAHHLAVFSLVAVLAAEWGLVRRGMPAADIRRLARIDAAYGAVAAAVVIAGVSRVIWGAKPADFYLESITFWLKMAALAAVSLLSIRPSIRFAGWRRALEQDPSAIPSDQAVGWARRMINLELAVFRADPDVRSVDGTRHRRLAVPPHRRDSRDTTTAKPRAARTAVGQRFVH